jgi:SAM-dependent methyltransferase
MSWRVNPVIAVALNQLLRFPLVVALSRRTHQTGMMNDGAAVEARLATFLHHAPVAGADLLELGPGQSPALLIKARERGARTAVGLDIERYSELTSLSEDRGVKSVFYDGRAFPFDDGTFDIVWSSDVLEHVRDPELTVREAFRVLRPGGLFVGRIDFRDHYFMETEAKWNNCHRFPEWLWNAMTDRRGSYVNRWRASDWRRAIESGGFQTVSWEEEHSSILARRWEDALYRRCPTLRSKNDAACWRVTLAARRSLSR